MGRKIFYLILINVLEEIDSPSELHIVVNPQVL